MKQIVVVAFLGVILFCQSCTSGEPTVAAQVKPLAGSWQLIAPDSAYAVTLRLDVDPNNPPLDITPFNAKGKLVVNTYSARLFAAADGKSSVDLVTNTEVGGSPQVMQFEQTHLANLKAVVRYQITAQNQLRLQHAGPTPGVLVYKKVE